jgi:23S rRNA G2445 N2-methylase RlmL
MRAKRSSKRKQQASARHGQQVQAPRPVYAVEADVTEGLEAFAQDEIKKHTGQPSTTPGLGVVQFRHIGHLPTLFALQTVNAVYLMHRFEVPRPRALLGHDHFHALLADIQTATELHPPGTFKTLRIDAAGSHSSVMQRLKETLSTHTRLNIDDTAGDLLIRLRRPPDGADGWDALIRLTPRPLSTRPWRVCNYEGALNATVAHCMALMTRPAPDDVFLNVACGSGTLLIERRTCAPARQVIGCDIEADTLACARTNIASSLHRNDIALWQADGRRLPLTDNSVDALCADLPFGQLVGSHDDNITLYPAILNEAARVAKPGARLALITHEVRLMESLLDQTSAWSIEDTTRITLRGLHPRIYELVRNSDC